MFCFFLIQALPLAVSIQHLSPIRVVAIAIQDNSGGRLNKETILQIIHKRVQNELEGSGEGLMFFPLAFSFQLLGKYLFTVSGPAAMESGDESNVK